MCESQRKKEVASQKKNDKTNTPLIDRISSTPSGKKGLSSNTNTNSNKKACKHCGKDNHVLDQCHFLGKSKCPDCKLFHNSKKCPDISSGNSRKRPWKGKDKDDDSSANKKKKQSHNVDDSSDKAQSNVVIPVTGKFVSFTGDEEADASDDKDFDHCVNNYTSLSKYTDRFYDWLADSGSMVHITSRREAFNTYVLRSWTPPFIFPPFSTIYSALLVTHSPLVPLCAARTATKSPDKSPDGSPDHSTVRYHMPSLHSLQHHHLTRYELPAHDALSINRQLIASS